MKQYKFKALIEDAGGGGACVLFPFDTEKEFGTRGQVPVKAMFDGVSYTGTMIKYGRPQHMLPVMKNIRAQIGKGPGDTVEVVVARDTSERAVEVPPEFAKLLKKEKLLPFFDNLSYTHRKEYVRWITDAKKEETRTRRLAKAVEMMKAKVKTPG
ncbi:MAG TPA: YdeI/OmpD-associated family protein [Terracidiphilus sp.]|nr:YdeI/OmpD-associated family protein [Terracidiphilus sp.]